MMNFSAFGGPFSGIHQFAAKFGHDTQTPGAFTTPGINGNVAAAAAANDNHVQRYQTNGNHFQQNVPNGKCRNENFHSFIWFTSILPHPHPSTSILPFILWSFWTFILFTFHTHFKFNILRLYPTDFNNFGHFGKD